MSHILLGLLGIWGASFLILALLMWRAPLIEEMLDLPEGEPPARGERTA